MSKRTFVDFYLAHNISPVSQDISNLQAHFQRRAGLYRQCGIVPALIKNKRVLEFGPGSGHNALFTLSLNPAVYHLVEGNAVGIQETECKLRNFKADTQSITELQFSHSLIENFPVSQEGFDVVLCEGLLPFQSSAGELLRTVYTHLAEGGLLLITCADSVSFLSDILRKIIGLALTDCTLPLLQQAERLSVFFAPHFSNLPGMTRPVIDWVLDNVLQPFYGKTFSIAQAIDTLAESCTVHATSPAFLTDWRWYKDIHSPHTFCAMAREQYFANLHNFIDYRVHCLPRSYEQNKELFEAATCIETYSMELQKTKSRDVYIKICMELEKIITNLQDISAFMPTVRALAQVKKILSEMPQCSRPELLEFSEFSHFFGRGQQYLALIDCC